jgi:hypothetical protein
MRNVAWTAVVAASVAVGSVAIAPAARADVDFGCSPGCWGAIATSASTGQLVIRSNYHTRQKAEDDAVLWCDVYGKTNDCQVALSGLGCLSIAESADGKTLASRQAFFQDAADAAALAAAGPGSKIDLHDCSG